MPTKFKSTVERIKDIMCKKGVTIHLDTDGNTELAQMGSMYSYDKQTKILVIVNNRERRIHHKIKI